MLNHERIELVDFVAGGIGSASVNRSSANDNGENYSGKILTQTLMSRLVNSDVLADLPDRGHGERLLHFSFSPTYQEHRRPNAWEFSHPPYRGRC